MEMDKRYNHESGEKESQKLWDQHSVYTFSHDEKLPVYSIDTPPPTVSGTLHIGHIFSYTHTDIVARYKRMRGFNVFYPMGFDDNGLPTERYVEKKNKTKAHLMKRSEFIELCLKESAQVEKDFEQLWRAMGLSVDWSKTYSTISERARKISQLSFIELYEKGLAYRKMEPSLYCTTCRTSVAQAELDSAEVKTTFNDLLFTTQGGQELTIATTRPELLPACVAVFFHPSDDRYKHLEGQTIITPVFNKEVKILADELVDPEKGTGLVMCCTFGDQNDITWYKQHKLPFMHIVGFDGKWTAGAGPLEGLRVHEARKKVLELLQQENKLVNQKPISHNVNTHERCKQEIEYVVLQQWFINILDNKQNFLDAADTITWKPEFMKARYKDWVQHLNWDWCISRQRFYGIPFPIWHCTDCEHVIVADKKTLPIDPQEEQYPEGKCSQCGSQEIVPDTDVMDTWNTSSLTPQINWHWPEGTKDFALPMSMRPQAHDIIRTWAFDTIVKSMYHHNQVPWKDIVISGHVLAGKEKISKSQANDKMKPEVLLKTYPADVIRFWSASGKLGTDTAFSENQLKIGQKLITKLWNAFRFFGEHIQDVTAKPTIASKDILNQWLLNNVEQTLQNYVKQFDDYEYSHALEVVDKLFWTVFCDNYLELVKDRFFNPDKYDQQLLEETRGILYEVGLVLLKLYAPFLPHITEQLYQRFYQKVEQTVSLHMCLLEIDRYNYQVHAGAQQMKYVLSIVDQVRKLKSEQQISLKTELEQLVIHCADSSLTASLQKQEQLISGVTKAAGLVWDSSPLETATITQQEEKYTAHVCV